MTRRSFATAAVAAVVPAMAQNVSRATSGNVPKPYGVVPSPRQMRWHELETYAFLHFTMNTFTDKEWGYGDEDPALFNPAQFDADAIVEALQAGGMKGLILTCKHHDGFCLWPTRTTEHSVRKSPWRNGKGDVVRELSEAARRRGLQFGVYVSPWDRNHPSYGSPEYVEVYRNQLRELLAGYGPLFEVWHDGANGGDGFYGGARQKRSIDKHSYYGWEQTWEMIRKLQPNAVIFSDVGPDIRWVGNEKGIAGETCWATATPVGVSGGPASPGDARASELNTGTRNGERWLPAECDVSIRPGWFWHAKENDRVKTPEQLLDLYTKSVGRGASFLLNIPPDRRGLLHENDVASLQGYGALLRRTFGTNLAGRAEATASNVRGNAAQFAARNMLDGNPATYWATDDTSTEGEAVLTFRRPVRFQYARVREFLPLGQRVEGIALDAWRDGDWKTIGEATSVGACRILRTAEPITTERVRLRVKRSPASAALSEFALFEA